ncbi:MAG: response regulator [Candidatus Spechtbacterales bacterium]
MSKKILFAEDEEVLLRSLTEILTQEGYDVTGVMDGESAIEQVTKNNPDLILLDLILPKKDGFEVLKSLKAGETTKHIPVIVLTNLESLGDISRALEAGASAYLVKANYDLEDVLKKIEAVLGT